MNGFENVEAMLLAELAADNPTFIDVPVAWSKRDVEKWIRFTRGRIVYRIPRFVRGFLTRICLKFPAFAGELTAELHVPTAGGYYTGWARGGDKQCAKRVAALINEILEAVGT